MTIDSSRTAKAALLVRLAVVAATAVTLPAALAPAQGARPIAATSCAPRAAAHGPVFIFGNEGGNLQRSATKLWADGSIQIVPARRTGADAALADSVRALARLARQSSFWTTTPPRITRPTRNPDVAREYLAVHLTCGVKRSLYPADAEPAPFHALLARLASIARNAAAR